MRYILFIIVLLPANILLGKKAPKYIKEHFTNCYTGKPTLIRQVLNIDGYYKEIWLTPWSSGYGKMKTQSDSFNLFILFYDDGTFVYNLVTSSDSKDGKVMDMDAYLRAAYDDPVKYRFYYQRRWGIYKLENDTLIMQCLHRKGSMNDDPWFALERKYKIKDRNTIERIRGGIRYLSKASEREKNEVYQESLIDNSLPATFIPCKTIPPPDCWLKQEDWLWCKDKIE